MNIKKSFSILRSRRTVVIVAVVLIAGSLGAYVFMYRPQHAIEQDSTSAIDYNLPTAAQKKAGDQIKQDNLNNADGSSGDSGTTSTQTAMVTIARITPSTTSVAVRTIITGIDSGECAVSFSHVGQTTISQTGTLTHEATSYSCSVDVPCDTFPIGGSWRVAVVIKEKGVSISNTATGNVEVQR